MIAEEPYRSSSVEVALDAHDPMRNALALARLRAVAPVPIRARAPWSTSFTPFPHIKLGVVVEGECWLRIDGREPLHLSTGDFYLLGNPPAYSLGSTIGRADSDDWNGSQHTRPSATGSELAEGEITYMCSVDFEFQDSDAALLFSSLPPALAVRADEPGGRLLGNIATLLVHEIETHEAGRSLVLEYLAQILLVHLLRSHAGQSHEPLGWLASVVDDGIGAALRAVHATPNHRWTLEQLARIAMMSRSAFSANFRDRVGKSPLDYVIEWRMQVARAALRTGDSITAVAAATGYQSESAFSTAFRRVVGMPPREFRFALHDQSAV